MIAAIDIGTVTSRLCLARVLDNKALWQKRYTAITDLGEGVDARHAFCEAAIERVLSACADFANYIAEFGAEHVSLTLTSAARDAKNAEVLLDGLRALGFYPRIISGEKEAELSFSAVVSDFAGKRICVADSGGGSTEIIVGSQSQGPQVLESINIGCRRITDRFFESYPPNADEIEQAYAYCYEEFKRYFTSTAFDGEEPVFEAMVCVGGTVTTLVALVHKLEPYDSSFVHLHELSLQEIYDLILLLRNRDVAEIASMPGIEPKRAHVIFAGALIMHALLSAAGLTSLIVSENGLLYGLVLDYKNYPSQN